jgi:DNA-binding transcriptional MerR regulator
MSRQYTISEIAKETGLTPDTLRFYEKKGLLESPERGPGSMRRYSELDLGRIWFIIYLRNTQMPLKDIQAYVQAYNENDESRCYDLLDEHLLRMEKQEELLKQAQEKVRYKLKHFQEIKDGKRKDEEHELR